MYVLFSLYLIIWFVIKHTNSGTKTGCFNGHVCLDKLRGFQPLHSTRNFLLIRARLLTYADVVAESNAPGMGARLYLYLTSKRILERFIVLLMLVEIPTIRSNHAWNSWHRISIDTSTILRSKFNLIILFLPMQVELTV